MSLYALQPNLVPVGTTPCELVEITPTIFLWQSYDPAVKADLFSIALVTPSATFIVDPIPLDASRLNQLQQHGRIAGVIVTNANHHRAAVWYSQQFAAPIFAHCGAFPEKKPARFAKIRNGGKIDGELEVIEIEGAVCGEVALYHSADDGTLIIGDALINFEPHGFAFLPRKYCENEKEMHESLQKLLDRKAERMFFAHGMPILSGASLRLRELLKGDP